MTWTARVVAFWALAFALACGSPVLGSAGTLAFSGALSGEVSALVSACGGEPTSETLTFNLYGQNNSAGFKVGAEFTGTSLPTGIFTDTQPNDLLTEGASVCMSYVCWVQGFHAVPQGDAGTFSLNISSSGPTSTTSTCATLFNNAHGTFTATLPAQESAYAMSQPTGTVTFDATF